MPRRSETVKTLTEKGKELQEERLKSVQRRYKILYEKWRCQARMSKEILKYEASAEDLTELIDNIKRTSSNVLTIYEELRQMQTPAPDLVFHASSCKWR